MVQRDTEPKLQFSLHRGGKGSRLPSRLSKMDRWGGVGPCWSLLHAKGIASPWLRDLASILQLGQHLTLPLDFTLEEDRAPCWWEKSLSQQLLQ